MKLWQESWILTFVWLCISYYIHINLLQWQWPWDVYQTPPACEPRRPLPQHLSYPSSLDISSLQQLVTQVVSSFFRLEARFVWCSLVSKPQSGHCLSIQSYLPSGPAVSNCCHPVQTATCVSISATASQSSQPFLHKQNKKQFEALCSELFPRGEFAVTIYGCHHLSQPAPSCLVPLQVGEATPSSHVQSLEEGKRFTAGSGWLSSSPHIRMAGIRPPEVLHISGQSRKCYVECIMVNSIPQGWGQKNVHSFFSSRSIRAAWEHSHLSVGDLNLNFGSKRFWRVHTSQLYLVFDLLSVAISFVCCDQKADTGWLPMTEIHALLSLSPPTSGGTRKSLVLYAFSTVFMWYSSFCGKHSTKSLCKTTHHLHKTCMCPPLRCKNNL